MTTSSRRPAPRDEPRRSGDICPGSGADARSRDRAAVAGHRAILQCRARLGDRPGGPSASPWPAAVLRPGARMSEPDARHDSLEGLVLGASRSRLRRIILVPGMPDANKSYCSNRYLRDETLTALPPCPDRRGTSSGLVHAVCDVKPAIVTGQSFAFTSLRQAFSLGLFALHFAFISFSFRMVSFVF